MFLGDVRTSFVCLASLLLGLCCLAQADLNDGLVAYYPFNGNANDESGNGNVTEVVGATLTTGKDGIANQAYLFDGVDDYIKCSIGEHQEVSVSLWYRSDETHVAGDRAQIREPYPTIFRYGGSAPGNRYVSVGLSEQPWGQNLQSYLDIQSGVYDQVNTLGPLEQGVWRHAVVIKSASELTLYLDGELIDSVASTALLTGSDLYLGSSSIQTNTQNTDFLGAIDELRVYDRALTAAEILDVAIGEPIPQFQIIEGNFSWQEAKADAEAKGGRLAVLDTQEKIDAANSYLEELGEWPHLWIGATDEVTEGDWRWVDGTALTVGNWSIGEPNNNNNGQAENYALITSNSSPTRFLEWNDAIPEAGWNWRGNTTGSYLLEINPQNPVPPIVQLGALYESPSGEAIVIDATPTAGFPAEYTYQWRFNGFTIPAALGGAESAINIDNLPDNEGTWSVIVTNETGSVEQSFEYRIYADSDSDGLSDAYEELISMSDINNPDTDADGLRDAEEVNDYRTNPNSPDTDSDGFTDAYELQTAYDPNSADSAPDAQVGIMTAIEVNFNAALGATYDIQFSTDSVDWTVIEAGIVGEGNAVERLYSKKDFPTGFFRVERTDQ